MYREEDSPSLRKQIKMSCWFKKTAKEREVWEGWAEAHQSRGGSGGGTRRALFPPFLEHPLQSCTSEWSMGLREGKIIEENTENEKFPLGRSHRLSVICYQFFPSNVAVADYNLLGFTNCSPKEHFFCVFKDYTTSVVLVTAEPKSTISSENFYKCPWQSP